MKTKASSSKRKVKSKRKLKPSSNAERFKDIPALKKTDLFKWADYFELLCLSNSDKLFTKGEVIGTLEVPLRDSIVDKELFDSDDDSSPASPQGKRDKIRFFADELYKMFEYRGKVYGAFYPFKLVDGDVIHLKAPLSIKNKLYIYLLSCSNLLFFPEVQNKLTTEFEYLSKEILKRFLSPQAEIHHFGANIKPTKYSGKLFNKIAALAEDLNCDLIAKEEEFSPQDTGDGGLDIVAWFPFRDLKWSRLIILAQCKCSDDWINSRFSSSLEAWDGKIHFKQPINNMTFIPMCYRRQTGAWHVGHNVTGTILLDRQRLIECLGNRLNFFKKYESVKFVETILK